MENRIFEKRFKALGTDVEIRIVAESSESIRAAVDIAGAEKIYQEKEKIFSRFDPESELSLLNGKLGKFCKTAGDMAELAQKSLGYHAKSQGIFDPRIIHELERIGYEKDFKRNKFEKISAGLSADLGKELKEDLLVEGNRVKFMARMDLSGIAKGYITDRVADFIFLRGWKNFLIDSGGDMFAKGKNQYGENWGIALEGAKDENEIVAEITNEGLATSGNTRRHWENGGKKFHHLINPKEKDRFDFDLRSVTVVSRTAEEADVMAKTLFILGLKKGIAFAKERGMKAIFLKDNQEIIKVNV